MILYGHSHYKDDISHMLEPVIQKILIYHYQDETFSGFGGHIKPHQRTKIVACSMSHTVCPNLAAENYSTTWWKDV